MIMYVLYVQCTIDLKVETSALTSLAVPISFCHHVWLFILGLDGVNDERTPPSSNWDWMLHKAVSVIRLSHLLSSAMVGDFERGDEFRISSNVLLIQSTLLWLFNLGNDICNLRLTGCNGVENMLI